VTKLPLWSLFALGSALFAGMTVVFAKQGVAGVSSNVATLLRTFIILVFLFVIVQVRNEWPTSWKFSPRSLIFLTLSGLATGLSWICYFRALQLGPASLVATVDKLSLAVALGFSVLFLGERLNGPQWLGTGLMILGALIVTLKK
jgi:bacterial/archaeal transporter family protein